MPEWAAEVRKRLSALPLSPEREAEIIEELSQHLEDRWQDLISGGADPDAATQVALAEFSEQDLLGRELRPLRQARWVDSSRLAHHGWWSWHRLLFDMRQSLRALRVAPGFTLVALVVLTLSIGATTAIVSVVDAVILRGLPFRDAGRLVAVGEFNTKTGSVGDPNLVAPQNFLDWRAQQDAFTGLAAIGYASVSLRPENEQEPETLQAQAVTADFFSVLGVTPILGRTFTADNERAGNARVAVISYGLWQRRFGGAPDVVGRRLPGQLADFEILGVMPLSFAYPVGALDPTEVWLPNVFRADERVRGNEYSYRLQVIGRLRPGISIDQAQARMDLITTALAAQTPSWFEDRVPKVEFLHDYLTNGVRRWMFTLLGAVVLVLLIACVNLSNLALARASSRAKEFAIRSAFGASRGDLARPLVLEGLVLSLMGGLFGVLLAWAGVELIRAALPAEIPRAADIGINLRVLTFTASVAIAAGLICAALPMFYYSRHAAHSAQDMSSRANSGSASHRQFRGALVITEIAMAVVLLVGAGLFIVSFQRVASVNLGLDPHHVLTVRVRPLVGAANWQRAQQQNRFLLGNILERVRAIPGVEVASLVGSGVPLRGDLRTVDFGIPGRVLPPGEDLDFNEISAEYFQAVKVQLIRGRFFNQGDREGSEPVAIINDAAAKRYFPGEDPIGKIIQFEGLRTVIGVVGNIRHDGPETDWRGQGFVPLDQSKAVGATLALRLSPAAGNVVPAVKAAIWAEFPGLALPDIQTLDQYLRIMIAQRRFNMLLLSLFGLLGIVIALVGIYGVMAYDVTQRTLEIGIRMALGAVPAAILRLILGRAVIYLMTGLFLGLVAAWSLGRLVTVFLFRTAPGDITVYVGVGALLAFTGLAAAFVPARRAAQVDPLISMRPE